MLADAARFGDLTTAEVVSDAAVVMFGGIDTTDGMIANAVLHLLSDPGQLELVRVDPRLVPAAIEESLRLEPAAALVDRYATRDVTIGEARVRVGDGDDGDDGDEVVVLLHLRPLAELGGVLHCEGVNAEHVPQQREAFLTGVGQVHPQQLARVQRFPHAGRLQVGLGPVGQQHVPVHGPMVPDPGCCGWSVSSGP